MAFMMTAIVCAGFASCGDDNEPDSPAVWSSSYEMKFKFSEDVLNTAVITAHIANPDGTFSQETVTTTNPSWELSGNKLPDKAGVLITFVPKSDIDPDKVYDIAIDGGVKVTSYRDNGVIEFKSNSIDSHMPVKGDMLIQYYESAREGFAYGVKENGAIVVLDMDGFDFGLTGFKPSN